MIVVVFTIVLPFLGLTVNVTLHEPDFSTLMDLPAILHTFEEVEAIFADKTVPEATGIFK